MDIDTNPRLNKPRRSPEREGFRRRVNKTARKPKAKAKKI